MDNISRQDTIEAIEHYIDEVRNIPMGTAFKEGVRDGYYRTISIIKGLPSAEFTHREKALLLLLDWAVECGFGYDNIPEEYAIYEKDVENMGYTEGLIYIAERELEHNERHDI